MFFDAKVVLGTSGFNQSGKQAEGSVRLVGSSVAALSYWIATDRFDLTAEQMTLVDQLRWNIEKFFGLSKRQLNVYFRRLVTGSGQGLACWILGKDESRIPSNYDFLIYCNANTLHPTLPV